MNILVFSPIPSHPSHFGHRKRIYNLTKYFQQCGHKVHFVYFNEDPLGACDCDAMQREWDTFTLIPRTKPLNKRHGNYAFDEWYQDDIHTAILEIIELFGIDMVWMHYVWQSKLLEYLPDNIYKVIDTHDKFTDRCRLLAENGDREYAWFSCSGEDEGRYLDRADTVVAIQDDEADYFRSISRSPVAVVGHLEQTRFVSKPFLALRRIGFVGARGPVNETGLLAFLEAFYAQSRSADTIEIAIAGTVCEVVPQMHPNLNLQGVVDDLDAFYRSVDLVINPQQFGTGLKIKSVEALAYGLPIVSGTVGFEGIQSDSAFHKAADPEAMVSLIDALHDSPAKLRELSALSRTIHERRDEVIRHTIRSLLQDAAEKRAGISGKPEKENGNMLQLYRQLQHERIRNALGTSEGYSQLSGRLRDLCAVSALRHPWRKLQAYKKLLETYHFFRKQ